MRLIQQALTFDDVLLVPAHSTVLPREVNLTTQLTKKNAKFAVNSRPACSFRTASWCRRPDQPPRQRRSAPGMTSTAEIPSVQRHDQLIQQQQVVCCLPAARPAATAQPTSTASSSGLPLQRNRPDQTLQVQPAGCWSRQGRSSTTRSAQP